VIARDLDACLARIRERDGVIQAWVAVAPQPATGRGALDSVPFGAKDIIDTSGLPTEYGSPLYRGRMGTDDAAVVKLLKARGAVLVGKTHTTAFAHRDPAPTRNPHNITHTPGGSSSGSAAAVADGMVPLALGTQTQGSVLRPASFCGVVGFKPTYGVLSMEGILPFAPSLDTLGFFTRSVDDAIEVWNALSDVGRVVVPSSLSFIDPLPPVDPPMATAFRSALDRVRTLGFSLHPIDCGDLLDRLNAASRIVMCYEAARVHEERYRQHGSALGLLVNIIQEGQGYTDAAYDEARRFIHASRERMNGIYAATPAILAPAAVGPAPEGLASTGDPRMNAPWTALGTPAISIPMGAHEGLPLGLQITANRGDDAILLSAAARVFRGLSGPP
jgi:Asp-tRNA(Asn)/Glu-tRNA(Gln) amidotransferase A subunit family amidase